MGMFGVNDWHVLEQGRNPDFQSCKAATFLPRSIPLSVIWIWISEDNLQEWIQIQVEHSLLS